MSSVPDGPLQHDGGGQGRVQVRVVCGLPVDVVPHLQQATDDVVHPAGLLQQAQALLADAQGHVGHRRSAHQQAQGGQGPSLAAPAAVGRRCGGGRGRHEQEERGEPSRHRAGPGEERGDLRGRQSPPEGLTAEVLLDLLPVSRGLGLQV